MRKKVLSVSILLTVALIAAGCTKKPSEAASADALSEQPNQTALPTVGSSDSTSKPDNSNGMTGTVLPPGLGAKADDSVSSQPKALTPDSRASSFKASKRIAHRGRHHHRSRRHGRHHHRRHHHKKRATTT
jgi:hypothetical protein